MNINDCIDKLCQEMLLLRDAMSRDAMSKRLLLS